MKFNAKLSIPVQGIILVWMCFVSLGLNENVTSQTAKLTPAKGDPIVQVTVPTLTEMALVGEQIFNAKCAACHGENAAGREGFGPPFIHPIYKPGHHGDMAFMMAPRQGVQAHHWPFGNMPPIEGLTDGDIKQVIAYVRTLQRANGIE